MSRVAQKFKDSIAEAGPESVAFYGSGQLFTEESYTANKLFKAGIPSNNGDGNPRLCMASAATGYPQTFGKDEPPGSYEDIDHADCSLATWRQRPRANRHLARYTTQTYHEPIISRTRFDNHQCLKCHQGKTAFEGVHVHHDVIQRLESSNMSCLNCHGRGAPHTRGPHPGLSPLQQLGEAARLRGVGP